MIINGFRITKWKKQTGRLGWVVALGPDGRRSE
jgi:hypothetical protein